MIQEITDLIFDLIGVGVFGGDHNLSCLLAQFLENLVNTLIKKVIRIRTLFWILFSVYNGIIDGFKNFQRICFVIFRSCKVLEKTGGKSTRSRSSLL